jgi:hypothetical protein
LPSTVIADVAVTISALRAIHALLDAILRSIASSRRERDKTLSL